MPIKDEYWFSTKKDAERVSRAEEGDYHPVKGSERDKGFSKRRPWKLERGKAREQSRRKQASNQVSKGISRARQKTSRRAKKGWKQVKRSLLKRRR